MSDLTNRLREYADAIDKIAHGETEEGDAMREAASELDRLHGIISEAMSVELFKVGLYVYGEDYRTKVRGILAKAPRGPRIG